MRVLRSCVHVSTFLNGNIILCQVAREGYCSDFIEEKLKF